MGNVLPADCAGVQHGDFYAVLLKFFRAERNLAAFRRVLERVLQKVRDASHEQERVRLKVKILRAFLLHAEFYFFLFRKKREPGGNIVGKFPGVHVRKRNFHFRGLKAAQVLKIPHKFFYYRKLGIKGRKTLSRRLKDSVVHSLDLHFYRSKRSAQIVRDVLHPLTAQSLLVQKPVFQLFYRIQNPVELVHTESRHIFFHQVRRRNVVRQRARLF